MNMVRNEDIGQINRRGNSLWLPKIMGRHVERSNVYYTRPAPTRYVPMNMVRNEDIGQINRRGNPLWLPKNKGRHVKRSNV